MKPKYSQRDFTFPPDMPKEPSEARQKVIIVKKKSKPTIQKTNPDSVPSQRALSSLDIEKNNFDEHPCVINESDNETYEEVKVYSSSNGRLYRTH